MWVGESPPLKGGMSISISFCMTIFENLWDHFLNHVPIYLFSIVIEHFVSSIRLQFKRPRSCIGSWHLGGKFAIFEEEKQIHVLSTSSSGHLTVFSQYFGLGCPLYWHLYDKRFKI